MEYDFENNGLELPEDDFENDGMVWPEEDEETLESEVMDMLMELCSDGEVAFEEMYNELLSNPYITEHPEKFKKLKSKIEKLLGQINKIWDE